MSDSSPFDDAPEAQYEDAPADQREEKEEQDDEEEEEDEEPAVEVEEEDPFADVPAPSAQSTQGSAPSLDDAFAPAEPEVEQETALRSEDCTTHSTHQSLGHHSARRSARQRLTVEYASQTIV